MKVNLQNRFHRGDKEASVRIMLCYDGKEVSLKMTKYHVARKNKLNLVRMDHMKNNKIKHVLNDELSQKVLPMKE